MKLINVSGKQHLIVDNFKFRESSTLKSGLISWRCCNKSCSSWLKTDGRKQKIVERKFDHNHNSTGNLKLQFTPDTNTKIKKTLKISSAGNTIGDDQLCSPLVKDAVDDSPRNNSPLNGTPNITSCNMHDLISENNQLKKQVLELRQQVDTVTSHAIESDTRLLQYTDEVFVVTPRSQHSSVLIEGDSSAASVFTETGTQCSVFPSISNLDLKSCESCKCPKSLFESRKQIIDLQQNLTDVQKKYEELLLNTISCNSNSNAFQKASNSITDTSTGSVGHPCVFDADQPYLREVGVLSPQTNWRMSDPVLDLSQISDGLSPPNPNTDASQETKENSNKYILGKKNCDGILERPTNTLTQNKWKLNDEEIKVYIDHVIYVPSNVLVLIPSLSQHIKLSTDPTQVCIDLEVQRYEYILAPVSDSFNERSEGTHWSLLVYERSSKMFLHLDSIAGYNDRSADALAARLGAACLLEDVALGPVSEVRCLQQVGGIVCGVHMLHNLELVCSLIKQGRGLIDLSCLQDPFSVQGLYDAVSSIGKFELEGRDGSCAAKITDRTTAQPLQCIKSNIKSKNKIIVVADSHGRDLGSMIEDFCSKGTTVFSWIMPNAKFDVVVSCAERLCEGLGGNDYMVIIGGTNDICSDIDFTISSDSVDRLANIARRTNVLLSCIPLRYDLPKLNVKIRKANVKLMIEICKFDNIQVFGLYSLTRRMFTSHGLHLNHVGKLRLCAIVGSLIGAPGVDVTTINVQDKTQTFSYTTQPYFSPNRQSYRSHTRHPDRSFNYQSHYSQVRQPHGSYINQPHISHNRQPHRSHKDKPYYSYIRQPLRSFNNQSYSLHIGQPHGSHNNPLYFPHNRQPLRSSNIQPCFSQHRYPHRRQQYFLPSGRSYRSQYRKPYRLTHIQSYNYDNGQHNLTMETRKSHQETQVNIKPAGNKYTHDANKNLN